MLQNLLSARYKKRLRIDYYMRLLTVFCFLFAGVFLAGAVTLLPSYVKVLTHLKQQEELLETRKSEAEESKNFSAEVKGTKDMLAVFTKEQQKRNLTEIVDELLSARPEGITLLGYSYSRKNGLITIEGFSEKRELVAPFARTLEEKSLFSKAPVPISDLAKNRDLDFRMQVTLVHEDENQ